MTSPLPSLPSLLRALYAAAVAGVCAAVVVGSAACREREADGVSAVVARASADRATFPCVHFEKLRRHLPEAPAGFARVRDEGSSGRYGAVSICEVERVFSGSDGQELSVRIVDTTMSADLARAIRAAANDASSRAKDDPTAPILQDRAVGFVRYDRGQGKAEANVLVADRFVVAVTSYGTRGPGEVRRVAGNMDFDRLALLR